MLITLYILCLLYHISMSVITTNTLPKLIMISGAVVGVISLLGEITYTYPIWISFMYSLLYMFMKAQTFNAIKLLVILKIFSIVIFIFSLILIIKI